MRFACMYDTEESCACMWTKPFNAGNNQLMSIFVHGKVLLPWVYDTHA